MMVNQLKPDPASIKSSYPLRGSPWSRGFARYICLPYVAYCLIGSIILLTGEDREWIPLTLAGVLMGLFAFGMIEMRRVELEPTRIVVRSFIGRRDSFMYSDLRVLEIYRNGLRLKIAGRGRSKAYPGDIPVTELVAFLKMKVPDLRIEKRDGTMFNLWHSPIPIQIEPPTLTSLNLSSASTEDQIRNNDDGEQ